MAYNYAEKFERQLEEKYERELTSHDFGSNNRLAFIDAQTIKVPTLNVSGYKDHLRDGSSNRGTMKNEWTTYQLEMDRDISFYADELDIDETNQVLSAANVTNTFVSSQAIPELDAYRYSKLFAELTRLGGDIDNTVLDESNILTVFDDMMQKMDEAGVPAHGRKMKVTPKVNRILKNAKELSRYIRANGDNDNKINRLVHELDDVEITVVVPERMMSAYDFSEGFVPATTAKQMNFILYHNSAIIAPHKIKNIYLWPQGTGPETAYGWLYKNRTHHDCFVIEQKLAGVVINADA